MNCCTKSLYICNSDISRVLRKPSCIYENKGAVTVQLISAFVFATKIEQSLLFLNLNFQASSHLLWQYSLVCVRPGQTYPEDRFSCVGAHIMSNDDIYCRSIRWLSDCTIVNMLRSILLIQRSFLMKLNSVTLPSGSQGELMVYQSSGIHPSSIPCLSTIFKDLLLQNRLASHSRILCGASLGGHMVQVT